MKTRNFLALDLGAESGRAILGRLDGEHLILNEVHRFSNHPVEGGSSNVTGRHAVGRRRDRRTGRAGSGPGRRVAGEGAAADGRGWRRRGAAAARRRPTAGESPAAARSTSVARGAGGGRVSGA